MTQPGLPLLLAGWVVWAAGFLLLYAVQATGCRMGWHEEALGPVSALRIALIGVAAIVACAIVLVWKRAERVRDRSPLGRIVRLANGAAALAALCFAGVLWLSPC